MSGLCRRRATLVLLLEVVQGRAQAGAWRSRVRLPSLAARFLSRPQLLSGHFLGTTSGAAAAATGRDYEALVRASVEEPESVWAEAAQGIEWAKPWAKTMERRDPFSTSW